MKVSTKISRQLRRENLIKLFTFLVSLTLFFLIVFKVENLLVSSVLALVMGYILSPLVNYLERRGLNRSFAIILIFLISSLLLGIGVASFLPFIVHQVMSLKSELSKYIEGVARLIQDTEGYLTRFSGSLFNIDLSKKVETTLTLWTSHIFEDLPNLLQKLMTTLLLAPFFAFFLLKDGRKFSKILLSLVPNNIFEMILNLYSQINDQIGQFVRARILEAVIVGLVIWVGLFAIGARYASLLALFGALTNLIPYIGPFIGTIPAIIMSLINGDSPAFIFMVSMVYFIAQLIDAAFIIPLVVAKIVDLHPITVVVAIIIGSQLMGVLGMLISIPVASTLKVTLTSVYTHLIGLKNQS